MDLPAQIQTKQPSKTLKTTTIQQERNQIWLEQQLTHIWSHHFSDVAQLNTVTIRWSRASRTRLGTITGKGGMAFRTHPLISEIRINALLQNPDIPVYVVWQTIAHELAHYCHGFCSPHPRKYNHPHRGNVIEKELYARNLTDVYINAQHWLKLHWSSHVASQISPTKRRRYAKSRPLPLLSHIQKIIASGYRLGK